MQTDFLRAQRWFLSVLLSHCSASSTEQTEHPQIDFLVSMKELFCSLGSNEFAIKVCKIILHELASSRTFHAEV